MRQALFAVLLVAASFAGGAAVNGPGLRWAQEQLANRFGTEDDGADHSQTLPQPVIGDPEGPSDIAATAIPPLVVEPLKPAKAEAKAASGPAPATMTASGPIDLPSLGVTELPPLERSEPPSSKGVLSDAAVALASLAGKAKAQVESVAKEAVPSNPDDWSTVRRSLRDLGASRYGVEGAPEGRARFYCVIPVAGRRAVSQYFEAEGDDEFQAAKAAIRRVALWRATEGEALPPEAQPVAGR